MGFLFENGQSKCHTKERSFRFWHWQGTFFLKFSRENNEFDALWLLNCTTVSKSSVSSSFESGILSCLHFFFQQPRKHDTATKEVSMQTRALSLVTNKLITVEGQSLSVLWILFHLFIHVGKMDLMVRILLSIIQG